MGGTVSASDTNGQGSDVWKYKGDFPDTLLCDLLLPGGWDYDGAPDNLSDFTFSEMVFKIRLIRLTIKQIRVTYRKLWNIFACWIQCREENRYDCRYQSPKWKTVEWLKDCHACQPPHECVHSNRASVQRWNGGTVVKRHRIPKPKCLGGGTYSYEDFRSGTQDCNEQTNFVTDDHFSRLGSLHYVCHIYSIYPNYSKLTI